MFFFLRTAVAESGTVDREPGYIRPIVCDAAAHLPGTELPNAAPGPGGSSDLLERRPRFPFLRAGAVPRSGALSLVMWHEVARLDATGMPSGPLRTGTWPTRGAAQGDFSRKGPRAGTDYATMVPTLAGEFGSHRRASPQGYVGDF